MKHRDSSEDHPPVSGVIRALDFGIVVACAPIWIPVATALGAAVLVSSGRPILFRQTRTGTHGQPFQMVKFRSMLVGPNPLVPAPDRITSIGRFLRRTSLDELPQLLNVIRGDMSLVGPRPMLPAQHETLRAPQRRRAWVRPGLTGLAQVNGRNTLRWDTRIEFDLEWVQRPTVQRYLRTLVSTISVVLRGDGVAGHDPDDRIVDLASPRIDLASTDAHEREHAA